MVAVSGGLSPGVLDNIPTGSPKNVLTYVGVARFESQSTTGPQKHQQKPSPSKELTYPFTKPALSSRWFSFFPFGGICDRFLDSSWFQGWNSWQYHLRAGSGWQRAGCWALEIICFCRCFLRKSTKMPSASYAIQYHAIPCHIMPYHISPYHTCTISYLYRIISYYIIWYHVIS